MELYLPRPHDVNGVTTSVFVLNQSGRDDLNNANLSITPQTNEIAVGSTILIRCGSINASIQCCYNIYSTYHETYYKKLSKD